MSNKKSFRLIQITDPHLHASLDGTLLGLETQFSLDLVLQKVREENPTPDAVLATGDIAQDGSVEAYQRFRAIMESFHCPGRWCPGNHDINANMNQVASGTDLAASTLELGNWLVVILDSSVAQKVYGRLEQPELDKLEKALQDNPDKHVLVTFHHHPMPIGSAWMDQHQMKNGADFLDVIRKYSNVRALLWGHIHQELDQTIDGVRYFATPSTCVQFQPKSQDFAIDKAQPGYRWFDLHPDGTIDTVVSRVENVEFDIDMGVTGY